MRMKVLVALFICTCLFNLSLLACTTMIAGKSATLDGSVLVTHSDDALGDASLIYVPAMDHKPGSLRAVYYSDCALGYRSEWTFTISKRLVTDERGPGYQSETIPLSIPIGYIPQVEHTYAYIDGNYGILNEHGLSMGECTDLAKIHPEPEPGKRIFYTSELSRVALERTKTAREAIRLMGELIERYGYYGTGETLTIADAQEGWVMEMAGYDMEGSDGVWVAQRVPDDEIFVAANQFRIREIIENSEDMMFSENIFDVAINKGWWDPQSGPLDFAQVYGNGEFHHPYYSLRRVWRALSLLAPSLDLPAWVEGPFTKVYPFSVKPDRKVTAPDLWAIHSDNYEGTEFDMTKGIAAGPFGNPNRFEGKSEAVTDPQGIIPTLAGAFERPLNIFRCAYVYVCQLRSWLPVEVGGVLWFGPDRPATAVLLPFYAGIASLPDSVQRADPLKLDRQSMWSAFNYVANYAMLKYVYMIQDIRKSQTQFSQRFESEGRQVETDATVLLKNGNADGAKTMLTEYCARNAADVLRSWWYLSDFLYVKYNDGYINTTEEIGTPVFYPVWWLIEAGYDKGPLTYEKRE